MKKLFSFVVVAALATSFASCGDKAPAAVTPAADATAVETSTVAETPAAETATPAAETATPAPH